MHTFVREEGHPLALRETYLAWIWGSMGSQQYQQVYAQQPDKLTDVTSDGNFSCAVYVSAILTLLNLTTGGVHTTVDETIRDMVESGWYPIRDRDRREGCVILWGTTSVCSDGNLHQHIGFYVGDNVAVSNGPESRVPERHHLTFGVDQMGQPLRPIKAIYFTRALV